MSRFDVRFKWGDTPTYQNFQIYRNAERPFVKRWVRAETQQQLLNQAESPKQKSRPDTHATYQTSWAGGATWWKPILGVGEASTYFRSNHLDLWSEPGKVIPMNKVVDAANTNIHDNCVVAVGAGSLYAIGQTEDDTTGFFDPYVWTPASDAFVRDSGLHTGVDDDDNPLAMVYDPSDGYFYVITDDPEIVRFQPSGNAEDAAWITSGFSTYPGANIFLASQALLFYSGDKLYSITKSGPSVTEVFDDGMGPEFLDDTSFAGTNPLIRPNIKLAVATPQGVYYVKNTRQGGQPEPWVFRVDKDVSGAYFGVPIATLPRGSVALSVQFHLGQLLITTSPDWRTVLANDTTEAEVQVFFVGEGGQGALGSILGGRTEADETPYAFLQAIGAHVYLAGQKRLWVYDSARGALHTAFEWDTELSDGAYQEMAVVEDSDGDEAFIFLGKDRIARQKTDATLDLDTVTSFGDDETYYTLQSNIYDGGLPMEAKRLSLSEIMYDVIDQDNQEWTLQGAADDGSFSDLITVDEAQAIGGTTKSIYAKGTGPRSRHYQTKIIYQTKTNERIPLRAVMLTFVTGEMVREWTMVLDGREQVNFGNEKIAGRTVADALDTMLTTTNDDVLYFLDNFKGDQDEHETTGDFILVKVMQVEEMRDSPKEGLISVTVRESPLTSIPA